MKFEVDIDKLISFDIDINQYLFLQFVYNQNYPLLEKYLKHNKKFFDKDSIDYLMSIELLKFKDEPVMLLSKLEVTEAFKKGFTDNIDKADKGKVEEWIEEWYDLWPKGIKSGSYPVRSGIKGCLTKMKKFIKEYPEYDADLIIKATDNYIKYSRNNNYNYMQLAHYFISKNNISTLAASCEAAIDNKDLKEVDYLNDI